MLLTRLLPWRRGRQGGPATPSPGLVVEEFEPRILYSADLQPWAMHEVAEVRLVEEPLVAAPPVVAVQERRHEIVFVDAGVRDAGRIVEGLRAQRGGEADLEVVTIRSDADGLAQIGSALAGHREVAAVHIVSHGAAGQLALGNGMVDAAALTREAAGFDLWRAALTSDADLLLWGCEVAQGDVGRAFIDQLTALTAADVAASNDLTGAAGQGGDWVLEATTGRIETPLAGDGGSLARWDGVLAANTAPVLTLPAASPAYTENGAPVVLDGGATVSDAELGAAGHFDGATLTLARSGGANAQDAFSATGTLGSLAQASGMLVVDGTAIGAYTHGGGTLVFRFNANATQALVDSALQQIAYANTGSTPPASVQIDWTFSDGNTGAQGTGGALAATGSTVVTITAVHDAPEIGVRTGIVTTLVGSGLDAEGTDLVVQPDGKVVVAGYAADGNYAFALVRYNVDGTLDTSFGGGDGIAIVAPRSGNNFANAVALQADGKFLLTGSNLLVRLDASGAFDTSFGGGDGIVTMPFGSGNDVVVQPDGKIVVAGNSGGFALGRFNADGSLDTSFGGDGVADASHSGGAQAIALQPDGKILVAGGAFKVARYNADGSLDTSFGGGGNGMVTVGFGAGTPQVYAVLVQPDGQIVLAGASNVNASSSQFALARLNANGTLDTAFGGGDGLVTTNASNGGDYPFDAALQADGKIVVTGFVTEDTRQRIGLVRYEADGTLDATFGGGDGIVSTHLSNGSNWGSGAAVRPDGRIVVGGLGSPGGYWQFAALSYQADGSLDTSFGALTQALGGSASFTEGGTPVVLDGDVRATDLELAAGGSFDGATLTLARAGGASSQDVFSATGTLDPISAASGSLVVGGTTIGSYTQAAGTLVFTFNGSATDALVDAAMQQIAYANGSDAPPASVTIGWTFSDANTGAQGTGGALQAQGITTVGITAVNDAPVLTLPASSPAFSENGAAVVLNGGAAVSDAELSGADNFNGATLTLARAGGADAQDVFSATGTLAGIGAASGNLVVGGTTIGTYTNGGGTLVLGFNANATHARVHAALQQIAYTNTSDAPPASVQIDWSFSDGNTGAQGTGGALTATGSTTVTITAVNDAPVLADTVLAVGVAEDAGLPVGAVGSLIGAFTGGIGDVDGAAVQGIAITGTVQANGTWYYSTNGGTTWRTVGAVSDDAALLLADDGNTRLYFAPVAHFHGSVAGALTLRAWDRSDAASAGTKVDIGSVGGASAYSSATDTVSVAVSAVNDAPTGSTVVTGVPVEGRTLTADASGIADIDGLGTFAYQWLRNGVAINGATSASYAAAVADIGAQLSVRVSYTDGGGIAESVTSAATSPVLAANDAPRFQGAGDGTVTTAIGELNRAESVTLQADGKILVTGPAQFGNFDWSLVRYNVDGTLDTSFGSDGVVILSFGAGNDIPYSVVVQDDGKILVSGNRLARFNSDGSLDTSFGMGGIVNPPIDLANIVVQPDGTILGCDDGGAFYVVRFTANGTLDLSFGVDGLASAPISGAVSGMVRQADGKIVLAGFRSNDFVVVRYNANGTLDTSFSGDGVLTTNLGGFDFAFGVAVQPDGKIVVSGSSSWSFALVRYNADGTLDTSFSGDGRLVTPVTAGDDYGRTVLLQPDGKIVVAGESLLYGGYAYTLARYNADGSVDTSFGTNGVVTARNVGAGEDNVSASLLQPDGKIVVVGASAEGLGMARFNADGTLDRSFDPRQRLDGLTVYDEGGAPVVLDAYVKITDAELSASDNFAGASLTLARAGGASAEDVFSATGTLASLAAPSGALIVGGITIGSYTNVGGTLTFSFGANATNALVNEAMRQIAYANAGHPPPAAVQLAWTFDDGNTGAQGAGGALQALGSTTVCINATPRWSVTGPADVQEGGSASYVVSLTGTSSASVDLTLADIGTSPADHADWVAAVNAAVAGRSDLSFDGTALSYTPPAQPYTVQTDPLNANFVDISATGTALNMLNDSAVAQSIGFTFQFFGQNYTEVFVSSNGALTFGYPSATFVNVALSTGTEVDGLPAILPFWDDLTPELAGSDDVYVQVVGVPGSRELIVQYNDVSAWSGGTVTFQVVLKEGSNDIEFRYLDTTFGTGGDDGASATIGITDGISRFIQFSNDAASVASGTSILFRADRGMADLVIDLGVTADGVAELDERFVVQLGNPGGSLVAGTGSVTTTIDGNDLPTGSVLITGTPTENQTLTADTSGIGDVDGLGGFSYQWLRDGVAIAGATGASYTLGDADVDATIRVQVTYTDGQGTQESLTSAAVGPVANVNDAPTGAVLVTGTPAEDRTLTADTSGIADADGLGSFSYQWLRDGVVIDGATGATYTLVDADVGTTIRVRITYTDAHGTGESVMSAAIGPVANVNDPPTGAVLITGTPTEDRTLTADTSGIADADGLGSFSYQWLRDGVVIGGATGATYTLGDADVGTTIRVRITYTDAHGTNESLTSAAVGPVANVNDAPTGAVLITGTPTEDQTLTADTSRIADADGLGSFGYQWLRDGVVIDGATGATYTLGDADVGATIGVRISYTDGHGTNESVTSAAVGTVANVNDAPTGAVLIAGTPTEDRTLTADTSGIADADGLGSFSYQWLRDGVVIDGATGATYTLGDADVGATIGVRIVYTDGHGTNESVTSAAVGPVANVNDAPGTRPVVLAPIAEDASPRLITQAELLTGASDADGDPLTASGLYIRAGGGSLVDNGDGTWLYTPAANDDHAVSFGYTVDDGHGGTVAGVATLDITPVAEGPSTPPVDPGGTPPTEPPPPKVVPTPKPPSGGGDPGPGPLPPTPPVPGAVDGGGTSAGNVELGLAGTESLRSGVLPTPRIALLFTPDPEPVAAAEISAVKTSSPGPELTEIAAAPADDASRDSLRELAADPARAASVLFTAGFVWWLTRSGGLLTSLLMTVPAWRHVDLLPVLARVDEDDEDDAVLGDEADGSDAQSRAPVPEPSAQDQPQRQIEDLFVR